jgi:hypothetical protein
VINKLLSKKALIITFILWITLTSCQWYNDEAEHIFLIKPSPTTELQPTQTPRATPQDHYCNDAMKSGSRTVFTFEEIVPCLDTIEKVSEFMKNNMMYDAAYDAHERSSNEYVPAYLVYERGVDDCDGHAILQCYLLEKNGYDAVMLGLSIDTPTGWNACAVTTKDGIFVLDVMGEVIGPFGSIEEAAQHFISPDLHLGTLLASQVTQITTNDTNPNVLNLPWTMIWK